VKKAALDYSIIFLGVYTCGKKTISFRGSSFGGSGVFFIFSPSFFDNNKLGAIKGLLRFVHKLYEILQS